MAPRIQFLLLLILASYIINFWQFSSYEYFDDIQNTRMCILHFVFVLIVLFNFDFFFVDLFLFPIKNKCKRTHKYYKYVLAFTITYALISKISARHILSRRVKFDSWKFTVKIALKKKNLHLNTYILIVYNSESLFILF